MPEVATPLSASGIAQSLDWGMKQHFRDLMGYNPNEYQAAKAINGRLYFNFSEGANTADLAAGMLPEYQAEGLGGGKPEGFKPVPLGFR